jgi:hypothetical protein
MPGRLLLCVALAGAAFPGLTAADVIFTDGTFDLSNYTSPFTIQSGPISDAISQCSACGDPGQALSDVFTLTTSGSATSTLDMGLLDTGFLYTPSNEGAILSVDASVSDSTSAIPDVSSYDVFMPLIEQDGNFFETSILGGPGDTGFVNLSASLAASDFVQINTTTGATIPASHPDFTGDTMQFGIIVTDGSIALPSFTQTIIYDNLAFGIVPAPEPGSVFLCAAPLIGLIAFTAITRGRRLIGGTRVPCAVRLWSGASVFEVRRELNGCGRDIAILPTKVAALARLSPPRRSREFP